VGSAAFGTSHENEWIRGIVAVCDRMRRRLAGPPCACVRQRPDGSRGHPVQTLYTAALNHGGGDNIGQRLRDRGPFDHTNGHGVQPQRAKVWSCASFSLPRLAQTAKPRSGGCHGRVTLRFWRCKRAGKGGVSAASVPPCYGEYVPPCAVARRHADRGVIKKPSRRASAASTGRDPQSLAWPHLAPVRTARFRPAALRFDADYRRRCPVSLG